MTHTLTYAAALLGRKGGQSTSPAKQSAVRANGALGGRPPREPYTTTLNGAPYGREGEAGKAMRTLRDAGRYARDTLLPGQDLDVLRGETVIARWRCWPDGQIGRVTL